MTWKFCIFSRKTAVWVCSGIFSLRLCLHNICTSPFFSPVFLWYCHWYYHYLICIVFDMLLMSNGNWMCVLKSCCFNSFLYFIVLGMTDDEILRAEMVAQLCMNDRTHSSLLDLISLEYIPLMCLNKNDRCLDSSEAWTTCF